MADTRSAQEDFQQELRLWDVPDDRWTDCFGDPQRQTLPDCDSRSKLCVCRSVVGHRGFREEEILPMKRCFCGAPLQLELMRAGAARGASEIECPDAQL